jgi:Zn-dependent M28 family amino/carboxypeptidase
MLGLAEYFAARGRPPERTLVFMVSGGHHTGNGPAAFIRAHPEIIARTVMVLNLEHVAQIAVGQDSRLDPAQDNYASGVWAASTVETPKAVGAANATPYVWELMGKAAARYGVVTTYVPSAGAPGDLGAYIRVGLPSAQLISSEVYYHSSGDTPSTISTPGLERAAAFYAGFIDDLARSPKERLKGPPAPPR